MPEPYGLTSTGFSAPTFEELRDKVNQRIWGTISPTLDLTDRSFEGQLIAIVCEQIILQWEMGEESNKLLDPDAAVDAALDVVCNLTGTLRPGAKASVVTLTLTGDPGSVIPVDSISGVPSSTQFRHDELPGDTTLVALTAWAPTTNYAVNARVTNAGNAYVCIEAGMSAGAGGPDTEDDDITDGAAHWRFMGEGAADGDVTATATVTGPLVANSGTITEKVTPVGGWKGVINLLDATPGNDKMSNAKLRQLRVTNLAKPGTGTADAIEADLLDEKKVPGVTAVTVFINNSDATDGDGVPPHSVEALVMGGEDQAIWNQLHKSVGGGIGTHGTEVGTVLDRRGRAHTYRFSRPDEIPIYVALTVTRDPSSAPSDLEDQILAAIINWSRGQTNGKNAVSSRIGAEAFVHDSVLEIEALIGTAPAPSSDATIQITDRQLATYDTSRISIVFIDGEP